ncbi:MAG: cytochrome P450 [Methylibium sp.]|nr:cytochrome P450 [Methylibium sp.]
MNPVLYRLVSAALHQPGLLRLAGRVLRRWPALSPTTLARHDAVAAAFRRPASFSNTAHAPNLVAGEFAIGMEPGPRHDAERAFLQRVLPAPEAFRAASIEESRRRLAQLHRRAPAAFDLIGDYMVWVAWAALRSAFGAAAQRIEGSRPPAGLGRTAAESMLEFFEALRHLGAHLLIGAVAPKAVQSRAGRCAQAVQHRVRAERGELRGLWAPLQPPAPAAVERNAVGLMWVAHPATVQACALLMQELLHRQAVYDMLRQRALALGEGVWSDVPFRALLRDHVLELLRFRPAFPILSRDVPRPTALEAAPGFRVEPAAGSSIRLLAIAAMFDPQAVTDPEAYWPGRPDGERCDPDGSFMIFGLGPRACIAGEHVSEVLVSALAGLLSLPRLRFADRWIGRMRYDGPIITRMRLVADSD